jgi:hypothetical protein
MKKIVHSFIAAVALIALAAPALAETLWSSRIGDINFPGLTPTSINNMSIGATTPAPGKFTTLNASGQITSSAGLPTIASGACGATTNGAIVAGSTNQSGRITIGAAATTTCTVSFSGTLASAPKSCVLFPMNATAAATGTTVAYISTITTSSFTLTGTVLASANYAYICL